MNCEDDGKMKDACIICKETRYSIKPPLQVNAHCFCKKYKKWLEIDPEFKIDRNYDRNMEK